MGYGLALLVLQYFFPITVLIYTYSRIALEIWWKKKPLEGNGEITQVFHQSREQRLTKARRKVNTNNTKLRIEKSFSSGPNHTNPDLPSE